MKNKAVSLMLSYVILIVIAISLAVAIYGWLYFYVWGIEPNPQCPDDVALIVQDYSCDTANEKITLTIKNLGRYNVSGYFVRGTNNTSKLPTDVLNVSDVGLQVESQPGRYDFRGAGGSFVALAPNQVDIAVFDYIDELKKIQLEPFRIQKDEKDKSDFINCNRAIVTLEIENCEQS